MASITGTGSNIGTNTEVPPVAGMPMMPPMDAAWNIGVWWRYTRQLAEAEGQSDVVQVQDLGSLLEQRALRHPGGAARVHEHGRIGLFGLRWYDGVAVADQVLVAEVVGGVAATDQHDVLQWQFMPHWVDVAGEVLGEQRVDEDDFRAGVSEDVLQLRAGEAKVERIDHTGAEEPGVVQLEVLVAVGGHDREPVAGRQAEMAAHPVGEPQDAVAVLLERRVIVAVVETDLVGPTLDRREELPMENEFLHSAASCSPASNVRVQPTDGIAKGPGSNVPARCLAAARLRIPTVAGCVHGNMTACRSPPVSTTSPR